METSKADTLPHRIGGTRVYGSGAQVPVVNPATAEAIAWAPAGDSECVAAAVVAAREAYHSWSHVGVLRRAEILLQFGAIVRSHADELVACIVSESGKTRAEAQGDLRRGIESIDLASAVAHLQKGESLAQIAEQLDGLTVREPVGVFAGITPFNFPAMIPLWMFPVAIACGNTFVLKPSEKTPLTAMRLAELFEEAGLPGGVLNVVHGGAPVVEALCRHPDVDGVSFVGSTVVAERLHRLASSYGKRVQAAGGAKNALVVLPDATPDPTLRAIMGSAFGCAGQRCMAGSLLLAVGPNTKSICDAVAGACAELNVGDPSLDTAVQMGPVIDDRAQSRARFHIAQATTSGASIMHDGRTSPRHRGYFLGPTLLDGARPGMPIFEQEVFGPVLAVGHPRTLDEALAWIATLPHGNGATLFTGSGAAARRFAREARCGMVGINVGVPAPPAIFPFAGRGASFYGDLHLQGMEGVLFYTRQRVVLSRWDEGYQGDQGW